MTSRKAPSGRRAVPPRPSDRTKAFTKDWTRLSHAGRYDMRRLKEVMLLLVANDSPLGPEWLDHPLQGEWSDHRECHVGGDFLLIYRLGSSDADSPVTFVRAGTHADLFTKATSLMRNTVREYLRGDGIEKHRRYRRPTVPSKLAPFVEAIKPASTEVEIEAARRRSSSDVGGGRKRDQVVHL